MLKLLPFLWKTNRREILLVAALGLLGGASNAALLIVVTRALKTSSAIYLLLAGFAIAGLLKVSSGVMANLVLTKLLHGSVLRMCDELCRRVLATPFHRLEEVGTPRILAGLTDDVQTLASAIQEVPTLAVNASIAVGCAIYLAWVSWMAAVAMLAIVLIGGLCYKALLANAQKAFELARDGRDSLFGHFRSLTEGIKELKLNSLRRDAFLSDDIGHAIEHLRYHNIVAVRKHIMAQAWSQAAFYIILGVLLFALPAAGLITREALTTYVFSALFTVTPMWAIVAALPAFNRGQTALERLDKLGLSLANVEPQPAAVTEIFKQAPRIQFDQVEFTYPDKGGGIGFTLGPVNLSLIPGELVFVIGGNGSGKSTFVKVLTGLYQPMAGEILVNGRRLAQSSHQSYCELFSVVYSDFFLFDRFFGLGEGELQSKAHEYLVDLQLAHKVSIDGNKLSTTSLSMGQRRRLALLMAYLEDRPVYVLDEWAADQDPTFREIFYTRLLPELKRRGKTVVVVTHDDRYYHLGDRIVNLDYGKIQGGSQDASLASTIEPCTMLAEPPETWEWNAVP